MSKSPEATGDRIPDNDDPAEAPLTMAASMILASLPRDASTALEEAGELAVQKVTIRLHPIGSAPQLTQRQFKLSSNQPFSTIIRFLRRKLAVKEHESVFCYVNNVFAPSLDEGVGQLWRCFKTNDELVVGYAMSPAFG
ncbi:ubiquitin-like protein ATG12 [Zopfia rhizophila CBS 207.26]|uniref:Ubiquitin-like protein ATG12 n=1 Tax=Zopfia rhizophila CBS 207.26 TaxID=1314779 RepID=A0A6A6EQQ8_9PEZI|nr:ubiquitin-like protein ATG12 [Zopfia rhizophila CBS 207.26]